MSRHNNNNTPSHSASIAARTSRTQSGKAARSKGTKNSSNKLTSFLELIEKVLPTGNELWELVVDLQKEKFPEMNWNATSIKIFFKLANEKPGTGNPSISSIKLTAKQISDADFRDFF
jgi:hypothetical protein